LQTWWYRLRVRLRTNWPELKPMLREKGLRTLTLLVSAGVSLTLTVIFTFGYSVTVDGEEIGHIHAPEEWASVQESVRRDFENLEVYIAGGKMRRSGSLVDSLATEFVSRLHFDICFITGGGLTADFGLSNGTDETASFQRAVIRNSRKCCLLIPSSKVGANAFIKVCDADVFDPIITDWDCVEEQVAALEEKGIHVTVVEEPNE